MTKQFPSFFADQLQVGLSDGVVVDGSLEVAAVVLDVVDIVQHLLLLLLILA